MQLKLLQWNILFKENVENIVKTIQKINPDIVNLQELIIKSSYNAAIPNAAEYIADKLGHVHYFHVAHRWKNNAELQAIGNGIFSRFPIETTNFFPVREEPETNIGDPNEGRVYVESVVNVNGTRLTIGNVHLSYVNRFAESLEKKKEADKLVEIIKDKKNNFILSGDLNSIPDSYTISQVSKYLVNCGPSFDQNTWTTKPFTQATFSEEELNWRLDYVFSTKDVQVQEANIMDVEYSDHLPILATFTV